MVYSNLICFWKKESTLKKFTLFHYTHLSSMWRGTRLLCYNIWLFFFNYARYSLFYITKPEKLFEMLICRTNESSQWSWKISKCIALDDFTLSSWWRTQTEGFNEHKTLLQYFKRTVLVLVLLYICMYVIPA